MRASIFHHACLLIKNINLIQQAMKKNLKNCKKVSNVNKIEIKHSSKTNRYIIKLIVQRF